MPLREIRQESGDKALAGSSDPAGGGAGGEACQKKFLYLLMPMNHMIANNSKYT